MSTVCLMNLCRVKVSGFPRRHFQASRVKGMLDVSGEKFFEAEQLCRFRGLFLCFVLSVFDWNSLETSALNWKKGT